MTKLKIWGRNNLMNVQKTMWGAAQISLRIDCIVTSNCSGAAQSNPSSRSKLWTNPVVWRSGMPNSTFSVRQV